MTRVRALLQRTWRVKPNRKHADLWGEIAMLLEEMGANNVVITKVAVYQDHIDWVSGFHQWCFLYNSLVNHATKVAHLLRPHQFWAVHERFQTEFEQARYVTNQVRQVMLRISRDVVFYQRAVNAAPKGIELQQTISKRPSPMQPEWVAPEYGLTRSYVQSMDSEWY